MGIIIREGDVGVENMEEKSKTRVHSYKASVESDTARPRKYTDEHDTVPFLWSCTA